MMDWPLRERPRGLLGVVRTAAGRTGRLGKKGELDGAGSVRSGVGTWKSGNGGAAGRRQGMSSVGMTMGCLLIAFVWNVLFWDRPFGVSVPIFVVIVSGAVLSVKRAELVRVRGTLAAHLLLVGYLSVCVALYRNSVILYATVPAVLVLLGALVLVGKEGYAFSNCVGVVEATAKRALRGVFAAPDAMGEVLKKVVGTARVSVVNRVVIGVLVSIPFLVVFTWLFTSADPVFRMHLRELLDFIWQPDVFKRGVAVVFMWFWLCGYMSRRSENGALESHLDRARPRQNYDGTVIFVFLLMINLLFVSFIAVQLQYLFGGAEVIKNSPFTYAEYVHRGFYEFWATIVLVSVIIIYTDYRLRETNGKVRRLVKVGWIALISQTFVIIASDIKRIVVYEEAYGYTYLRILVVLFLLWTAGCFIIFVAKIVGTRPVSWLISRGLCLGCVFLVLVSTFSIDNFIARRNVDRYLVEGKELDMEYLSRLSTDIHGEIERLGMATEDDEIRKSAEHILAELREQAENGLDHWVSWNASMSKAAR